MSSGATLLSDTLALTAVATAAAGAMCITAATFIQLVQRVGLEWAGAILMCCSPLLLLGAFAIERWSA